MYRPAREQIACRQHGDSLYDCLSAPLWATGRFTMSVSHRIPAPGIEEHPTPSPWPAIVIVLLIVLVAAVSVTYFVNRGEEVAITAGRPTLAENPELGVARRYQAALAARAEEARLRANPELKAVERYEWLRSQVYSPNVLAINPELRYVWNVRDLLAVNPELKLHRAYVVEHSP